MTDDHTDHMTTKYKVATIAGQVQLILARGMKPQSAPEIDMDCICMCIYGVSIYCNYFRLFEPTDHLQYVYNTNLTQM